MRPTPFPIRLAQTLKPWVPDFYTASSPFREHLVWLSFVHQFISPQLPIIMGFKTFFTLATLGLAAAETSVVSLFIFGADSQSLVGSVVAAVHMDQDDMRDIYWQWYRMPRRPHIVLIAHLASTAMIAGMSRVCCTLLPQLVWRMHWSTPTTGKHIELLLKTSSVGPNIGPISVTVLSSALWVALPPPSARMYFLPAAVSPSLPRTRPWSKRILLMVWCQSPLPLVPRQQLLGRQLPRLESLTRLHRRVRMRPPDLRVPALEVCLWLLQVLVWLWAVQ